jgi:signal transduction histidine kinase
MKTQTRIAVFLITTNILMLLLFGLAIYYFLYNYSYADFYKRLETRASITAEYNFGVKNKNSESYKQIRKEILEKLSEEKEYIFPVNNEKDIEKASQKSGLPLGFLNDIFKNKKANLQIDDTFFSGIRHQNTDAEEHLVIVSAKNYYASNHLLFLRNIILIAVLLVFVVVSYISFYFSKHIFDPIKKITDKVKEISTDNIHLRIPEVGNDKEINQLVITFNDLLNRLETAFETQKNFVSNASHEFGTPLTSIMGEAEVMLMKKRTVEEYEISLQSILSQAERLNEITQSLLYLSYTGYANKKGLFEITRVDEALMHTKEMYDKVNPKNHIQLDFSLLPENPFKLKIIGNKQLLYLAFSNILSNACKYSNNKPVTVSLASTEGQLVIMVKDQGIGIPEEDLKFIFDPFFRASNTAHFDGHGIGLPLTRNIIKMHEGQLGILSKVGEGTVVKITFPLANLPLNYGLMKS